MRRFLILTAMTLSAFAARADEPVRIVATVGDQAISSVDLSERTALVMGLSGIPDTPENRTRLIPQILRQLIDEHLQMDEAAKDGISITDAKLKDGVLRLEKQNGKEPGSIDQFLQAHGLSKLSFYAQIRAQLAWSDIVIKKIRPRIRISDQEVARAESHKAGASAQEVEIASIQLPVDSPESEAGVKKVADQLASQIRAGASFEAVASQFSSGTGGTKTSAPFWVSASQLDPLVAAAIGKAAKGQITDPVRTAAGYQIVMLMDTRTSQNPAVPLASVARAELAFKQILMTLKPDAERREAEILIQLAKEVAVNPGKCTDRTMSGVGDLAAFDFQVTLTRSLAAELPEKLRELLMSLKVGTASEPIITPQGIRLFQLCERIDLPAQEISAKDEDSIVRQAIYEQKLDLEAQKFQRNLRREAFIEIRMH